MGSWNLVPFLQRLTTGILEYYESTVQVETDVGSGKQSKLANGTQKPLMKYSALSLIDDIL